LIELVVVAIIALLLAILLPVPRVRSQAKAAVCQANLHQWGLLFNTLAKSNDGLLCDRDSWDRCRTQLFAYYLDNFDFEPFCPMAKRKTSINGAGGTFLAWYPGFDTHGPWTCAGNTGDIDWPAWMQRFED
jgi:hypothetical protein